MRQTKEEADLRSSAGHYQVDLAWKNDHLYARLWLLLKALGRAASFKFHDFELGNTMTVLATFAGLSDQPQFEAFSNLFETNGLELWDRID